MKAPTKKKKKHWIKAKVATPNSTADPKSFADKYNGRYT